MVAKRSTAQRLGRVLERVTQQSGRLPETPAYGSWLLGRVSESQSRRRVRIQLILTVFIVGANLIGIAVATLLLTVALPTPSIFSDAPLWITFGVTPAYCAVALGLGTYLITHRTIAALRWAIEEHEPTPADERATFAAPFWLALGVLVLWVVGTGLLTTLYGLADSTSFRSWASPSASAAFWCLPRVICLLSSRCVRWPLRHSRRAGRPRGWVPASWAGPLTGGGAGAGV